MKSCQTWGPEVNLSFRELPGKKKVKPPMPIKGLARGGSFCRSEFGLSILLALRGLYVASWWVGL